jgi:DNA (cytosine-5)-methyltransferase 1
MGKKMAKVKVVELFAGAGGLALGLENAGLEDTLLVEIDKDCVSTLKKNRPSWNVLAEDIRKVDFKGVKADVVTGGFPCQSFSCAGHKLGFEDTRGTLFFEFARAVKEIQPKMFVGENVAALKNHDEGKTLATILSILQGLGYSVQYEVLNAMHYEVPQKRERILIVGTKPGIKFEFPQRKKGIVTLRHALKDVPKSDGYKFTPRRKEILDKVPPATDNQNTLSYDYNERAAKDEPQKALQ